MSVKFPGRFLVLGAHDPPSTLGGPGIRPKPGKRKCSHPPCHWPARSTSRRALWREAVPSPWVVAKKPKVDLVDFL